MSSNIDKIEPVFDDPDEDKLLDKARQIVKEEIDKSNDNTQSNIMKSKIDKLRERIALSEKRPNETIEPKVTKKVNHEDDNTCPGCKGHDLHIHNGIAKCVGDNCGKEFLLLEKADDIKNKFMCVNCGHTIDEKTAKKLKETNELCPLCNKGDKLLDIDWGAIDKKLKSSTEKMFKR